MSKGKICYRKTLTINHSFKSSLNKGFKTQNSFSGKNFKYYTSESVKSVLSRKKEKSLSPPKWQLLRYLCPQNVCNSARLSSNMEDLIQRKKRDRFNFTYITQYMKNKICASFANLLNNKVFIIQNPFATMSSAFLFLPR